MALFDFVWLPRFCLSEPGRAHTPLADGRLKMTDKSFARAKPRGRGRQRIRDPVSLVGTEMSLMPGLGIGGISAPRGQVGIRLMKVDIG